MIPVTLHRVGGVWTATLSRPGEWTVRARAASPFVALLRAVRLSQGVAG